MRVIWISLTVFSLFSSGYAYFGKFKVPKILPKVIPNILPDEVSEKLNPLNLLFFNKCIDDLGCFHTGPPFYHPTARPISLPPSDPCAKFHLYTRDNPEEDFILEINNESLKNSTFDPRRPTKFVIHGFRSDLEAGDIRHDIRKALLENGDYNIIIVNWTENNGFPYAQAASNIRVEGAKVAHLIHFLINNTGISAESIHIIGHSLGGQMAGYIGERVPNIGRITGLDPAGPFFQDLDPEVRLDRSDALFVDVIHSDGGEFVLNGLGCSAPVGHMDFYPNGGRRQPGCFYASESETIVGAAVNYTTKWLTSGCDHNRVNEYFLESINNSECKFLAVQCSSYADFEKGLCSPDYSAINEMGFNVWPVQNMETPIKFFLRTNGSSPYCIEDSIFL